MNWDRFKAPTAADELARCQNCFTMFHYTELTEGYCADCRDEDGEEEEDEP